MLGYPGVSFLREIAKSEAQHQHKDEAGRAEPADDTVRVDRAPRCAIGAMNVVSRFRRHVVEGSDMVRGGDGWCCSSCGLLQQARAQVTLAGGAARSASSETDRQWSRTDCGPGARGQGQGPGRWQHGIKRSVSGVVGQRDERCADRTGRAWFTPGCRAGQRGRRASRQRVDVADGRVAVLSFRGGEEGSRGTKQPWRRRDRVESRHGEGCRANPAAQP